jgi:diguanylate cyclase (GGDEF)-like protein
MADAGKLLAAMFAIAGAATLAALLLDPVPGAKKAPAVALAAVTVAAAAVLGGWARRPGHDLPSWAAHGALTAALALISGIALCGRGDPTALAALAFFAWVPLVAAAFLPTSGAVVYLAASSVLCIVVVALSVHEDPVSYAVPTVATAAVAAVTAGCFRSLMLKWATTDPLTLLPTRQALPSLLEHHVARARHWKAPLTLAVIDLDHFKTVNETRGHRTADRLLRDIASHWRAALRRSDELVRYGGDEFVAVLPGCEANDGVKVMEDLRRAKGRASSARVAKWLPEELRRAQDHAAHFVTSSVGVAQWLPGEPVELTVARADRALCQAKREGRDRVVLAGPVPPRGPAGSAKLPGAATGSSRWTGRWAGVRTRRAARFAPPIHRGPDANMLLKALGLLCMAEGLMFLPTVLDDPSLHPHLAANLGGPLAELVLGATMFALARRQVSWLGTWIVHGTLVLAIAGTWLGPGFAGTGADAFASLTVLAWMYVYVFAMFPRRTAVAYGVLGSVLTMLYVASMLQPGSCGAFVVALCAGLGAGAVVGHLKQLLRRQCLTDVVTKLPNSGYLDAALARGMESAARRGGALSLAVIDLDHFKAVNDTDGQQAGDDILAELAATWSRCLGGSGSLLRYGGDEFVVLLPGCGVAEAATTLERLQACAHQPSSVGLTEWARDDTRDSLRARADAALHQAKDGGGGRVVAVAAPTADVVL